MSNQKNVDLLFCRPSEPVFIPKGDQRSKFEVPNKFLIDRYEKIASELSIYADKEMKEKIVITDEYEPPNIDFALQLDRDDEMFSLYVPTHRDIATKLLDTLMKCKDKKELESLAIYCRDRLNPLLFNYSFNMAILHRPDTQNMTVPICAETFPDRFVESRVFPLARSELSIVPDDSRAPIVIPADYTATNINFEQRIAYFREDIGVNLLYWNWHMSYPFDARDKKVVECDRRGERFYYLHEQILARYNCERMCNKLYRVERLNNLRDPIKEGYFPKLDSQVASRTWPPRFDHTSLRDLYRTKDKLRLDLADLETWASRIKECIEICYATSSSGNHISLKDNKGIDVLGNIVQASLLSPHKQYYGDLCNMGHAFIAFCHDPDNRYLESFGVMGDPATAMRDPAFYRWHSYLADLFQLHKRILGPYSKHELEFPGITVSSVEVNLQEKVDGMKKNVLQTFWQQSDLDISRGLDFAPIGSLFVRLTHLQHHAFTYKIKIKNSSMAKRLGTIRIFIAPKYDEREELLYFNDQRCLMVELDRFVVEVHEGSNYIIRKSEESNVTVPHDAVFFADKINKMDSKSGKKKSSCGCGWPQHMLIPKGTEYGTEYCLFVMVSDYNEDRVPQKINESTCKESTLCGQKGRSYPDARAMGYPFDRPCTDDVSYLPEFLCPNMCTEDVLVKFTNITVSKDVPTTSAATPKTATPAPS